MKKTLLLLALCPLLVFSQNNFVDRSQAPKPLPAKTLSIKNPETYILPNGLKLMVIENKKLPLVNVQLLVDLKLIQEGNKAGTGELLGGLIATGTKNYTKEKLDFEIEKIGGTISSGANYIAASCLKNNFSRLFQLFADISLNPSFPSIELEKIKTRTISGIEANKDDPEVIADNVRKILMYGKNHPYGEIVTTETINNISLKDVTDFYFKYWKPNISYLVFVGDISFKEAKELAIKHFGNWARQDVVFEDFPFPAVADKLNIAVVNRNQSVQSKVSIFTPFELPKNSSSVIPATLLNGLLGASSTSRLFLNLREKRGFTYGAYSTLTADRFVGNFTAEASVRNIKTDSAVIEFINEFYRVDTQVVNKVELENTKNYLMGSFARSLENPKTLLNFALNIERYNLPKNYYNDYLKNIQAVSEQQIKQIANSYINPNNMTVLIVGKAKEIEYGLSKIAPIKYYDIYGNLLPEPKETDKNINPINIIQRYLSTISPSKDLARVKDLTLIGTAEIQGTNFDFIQQFIFPNNYSFKMSIKGNNIINESIIDGQYKVLQNGQEVPVDEEKKADLLESSDYFREQSLLVNNQGYSFNFDGYEKVGNRDCYIISVSKDNKISTQWFYDKENFLKLKEIKYSQIKANNNITSYFKNYKTFYNVLFPTNILVEISPGVGINLNLSSINLDSGLALENLK